MAFKAGKNAGVKWNSQDITAYLDQASLDRIIELIETTTFSTSSTVYVSRVAGVVDVTIEMSGPYDPALESTAGMETDALAGTPRSLKYQNDTTAAASATNPSYTFTALLDGFHGPEADIKGAIKWKAKAFISTGSLARATSGAW